MSELSGLLERESASVDLVPGGFERLLRRRDRKRRNQRFASGVVALVLAVASIAGLLRAFDGSDRQLPAAPSITPENVSDLQPAWTAKIGPIKKGPAVAIADGMVLVQADDLYAFPQDCGLDPGSCAPAWVGRLPSTGGFSTGVSPDGLAVSDGTAYVAARDLFAFPTTCADAGVSCHPEWIGRVGSGYANQPVVSGDSVYVGSSDTNGGGRLFVFPKGCGSGTCAPSWVSAPQPEPLRVVGVLDGFVYATVATNPRRSSGGSLYAFPADCTAGCRPAVRSFSNASGMSVAIGGGSIFVSTATSGSFDRPNGCYGRCETSVVQAFAPGCATRAGCAPLWTSKGVGGGRGAIAYADGVVFASGVGRYPHVGAVYAADSGNLLWFATCCTHGTSYQSPVVGDGMIWTTSGSGTKAYPIQCKTGDAACQPSWSSLAGEIYGMYHVSKSGLAVSDSLVVRATSVMKPLSSLPHTWKVYAFRVQRPAAASGAATANVPTSSTGRLWLFVYLLLGAALAAYLIATLRRRAPSG